MAQEANGANLLLGRGKIYFERNNPTTGAGTGLEFLGNCTQLEITPSVERREKFSSTRSSATKLASVPISQSHQVAITMDEYVPYNLALALMGDAGLLAQASSTVTGETLTTSVKKGRSYTTAFRKISTVVVKKGASTLVLGTDYEILDATRGLIRILPGSVTVVDGDTVTVDYAYAADTSEKVAGGTVGKIEGRLVFIGDPVNGPVYDLEIWKISINPAGALALIQDDFGNIPLQGEILDDATNHPTEPLYRMVKRA